MVLNKVNDPEVATVPHLAPPKAKGTMRTQENPTPLEPTAPQSSSPFPGSGSQAV